MDLAYKYRIFCLLQHGNHISIQQSNISRLENGTYYPSIQLLEKIALAVGKELVVEFV